MSTSSDIQSLTDLAVGLDKEREPFLVPHGYFEQLPAHILAKLDAEDNPQHDSFFDTQRHEILSKVNAERNAERLTIKRKNNSLKIAITLTAAASVLFLAYTIWPRSSTPEELSNHYAQLMANTELSDEDLEYLLSTSSMADSDAMLINLTKEKNTVIDSLLAVNSMRTKEHQIPSRAVLEERTKKSEQIKPSSLGDTQNDIGIDDEDILHYLQLEADEMILDDWY